jgi:Uma2 family endonuclease
MTPVAALSSGPRIIYPDTDGLPMAENTLQFEWIVKIKGGLDVLFAGDPNVFVAGDLFWYPVEGRPDIRLAPDAMVAFGRPKGHRLSYMQWEEGGIPPQVVFEVLSPGNRPAEMARKLEFYQHHGVEEYYIYNPDPDRLELSGYLRQGGSLAKIASMEGPVSPRLKVRFEMSPQGLEIIRPDGKPFVTFEENAQLAEQERERADLEEERAENEHRRAENEHQRADDEGQKAESERQLRVQERQRAEQALAEVERLRQRLRSLGQDPG